jgi:hypothetical protein
VCSICESKSFSESNELLKNDGNSLLNYILIDLRITDDKDNKKNYDYKPGFLPMTVILDQTELLNDDVILFRLLKISLQKTFLIDSLQKKTNTILY